MAVAQAKTSMSASQARDMGFLRPTDRIVANKDYLIGEAKKEVLKMVDDGYAPPAKKKYPVMGREAPGYGLGGNVQHEVRRFHSSSYGVYCQKSDLLHVRW